MKKIYKIFILISLVFGFFYTSYAKLEDYTTLRDIDKGTFNEYRYYLVKEYFKLKSSYEVSGSMDKTVLSNISKYSKSGYNYLSDSLINQNLFNDLNIALQKAVQIPNSEVYYTEVVAKINDYIDKKINIQKVKGSIISSPSTGNAPLTTTFRSQIVDPSGTVIPSTNYIWWLDDSGKKKIIGKGTSINYTFLEEGNYSVFLDVKSSHKNKAGYTDVIPFSSRAEVIVKEKIASLIVTINGTSLKNIDEIKFSPEESSYGLIIDATSSTPTGGAKFIRTEWDFGNGITKKYESPPKIERVVYAKEGEYDVILKLTTNEAKVVQKLFRILIHKPIATIVSTKDDGYIGDKFDFSAKSSVSDKNLSYTWKIIDINKDKVIFTKNQNSINYTFNEKGKYNIQLQVKDSAGNTDSDSKIIYINSRAPVSDFTFTIKDNSKPNRVYLDGTKSYDLDISDQGKLQYEWTIDGDRVNLESPTANGGIGYYTFTSVGDHNITLEVIDLDKMTSIKTSKITINSILSVELYTFPKIINIGNIMKFNRVSPNASVYEWDFGDGIIETSPNKLISHRYIKSGTYKVKLKVRDKEGNANETNKTIYVGDGNFPVADININFSNSEFPNFDEKSCNGGAYLIDRTKPILLSGKESINIDGTNNGLTYSWKIGNTKLISGSDINHKFDELGCFPIKLTVISSKNGSINSKEIYVKVQNIKPSLSGINLSVKDMTTDPVVVNLRAVGATDLDGVVQSYLWYYYTDSDSDPQDFRITTLPSTTFVLPKITGNYYFVAVLRDNNDERFSSDESSSNKYFISLSGDNVNTPLIDFKVDKNNIFLGDEINFSVDVKNILGKDISSKAEYAWDFDGDGFYDKETKTPNITYSYEKSGTYYAKLRVKHKGMTNVGSLEIVVSNILKPEFEYVSLGNNYLFFNTSKGKIDSSSWDLGDNFKINDKDYFEYRYLDTSKTHKVSLSISEGTSTKNVTKDVIMSTKNLLKIRKNDGLTIFSYPEIDDKNKVILNEDFNKLIIYIPEFSGVNNYGIDYDILTDNDLNGEKDDDIDNIKDPSNKKGGFVDIQLNESKIQTFRVFLQDITGKTIYSGDFEITKDYINEKEIDLSSLTFSGVTDEERVKIEKLKNYITSFPQKDRLLAMQYVSQLQSEWFYPTEKTKVILNFEEFIGGLKLSNEDEVINLLESFLLEGNEEQSVRNMSYNVIKNLIPKEIVGYDDILLNLDSIKDNPSNIEANKTLGKQILDSIKDTSLISNDDKLTIKTQIMVLIYGSIENIPVEEKKEVKSEGSAIGGLLSGSLYVIASIFGIGFLILIGFFVWFKISNKNKNLGLQDFIIDKTNNIKNEDDILTNLTSNTKDNLSDIISKPKEEIPKPTLPKKDIIKEDIFSNTSLNESIKKEQNEKNKTEEAIVPDWLKGAIGGGEISSKPKEEIPKPLEIKEDIKETPIPKDEPKKEIPKKETPKEESSIIETKIEEQRVPDWLKGALDTSNITKETKIDPLKNDELTQKTEIPDWLKIDSNQEKPVLNKDENKTKKTKKEDKKIEDKKTDDFWTIDTLDSEDK